METIVLINPFPIAAAEQLGKYFLVKRLYATSELEPLLQTQEVKAIFCLVRIYHPRLSSLLLKASGQPKLVLVRTRLDKMEERLQYPVFYWKDPYQIQPLYHFFAQSRKLSCEELEGIHVMEQRRLQVIRVSDIILLKKIPPGQVFIHTREGDRLINANLTAIGAMLPEKKVIRISDQLMIPAEVKNQITPKGLAFRGGFIPIRNRYLHSRKGAGSIHVEQDFFLEQSY